MVSRAFNANGPRNFEGLSLHFLNGSVVIQKSWVGCSLLCLFNPRNRKIENLINGVLVSAGSSNFFEKNKLEGMPPVDDLAMSN